MKKIINTIFLLTVIIYLFFFASCREVIPKVSAPIFTPEGGTFNDYLYVTIYCPTTDATIRYTLDGSPPSPSYGIIYNQPIEITTTTTIRAIAYRDLMKSSEVVSATFTILKVAPISISPKGATYNSTQTITISCPTPGATIKYTMDGTDPSPTYGNVYTLPLQIGSDTNLKVIAYKEGMTPSNIVQEIYYFTKVATPSFSLSGGTYNDYITLEINCVTEGATIKYTTDGSDPSETNGTTYSNPIQITSSTQIKAIAFKSGLDNSEITSAFYILKASDPSFSPTGGTYNNSQTVSISCATPSATIKYTTDGSDPINGQTYTGPIDVLVNTTIKAIAIKSGLNNSNVITSVYNISKVATPIINPQGGTYSEPVTVSISCPTPGATIRYTTDGSNPSQSNGTVYSTPININSTTTIKAIAYKSGMNDSSIASETFTINLNQVAPPIISPNGGTYINSQTVTITTNTSGATIRYTTDGTIPSSSYGNIYSGPINLTTNTTINAIAYKGGMTDSQVTSAIFNIKVAAPTFSLASGTYNGTQSVNINCSTSGATIRYTTDGSNPTPTYGFLYTGAINISTNTTLKAIAYKSNMTDSDITTSTYYIKVATPTFSPSPGTYISQQSITISCSTSDATIKYTTDGTDPSPTNGNTYSGAITITASTTLKAMAYKANMVNSDVNGGNYVIKVATPTFSPSPGTYISQQSITISCSTSGATIKYTTDGTDPSPTNGNTYSGAITITASTTLKAMAYKANMVNSDVNGGNYVIKVANPTFSPSPGTYTSGQSVTINCSTSGATIRYTLDGSTPTSTSGTIYSGPITVSNCKVIKAIAYKSGLADSDVTTANYVINPFSGLRLIKDNINKNQSTEDVHISGNYAYLAAATYGLIIVNISSPSNPSIVKTVDTPGYAYNLDIRGSYAYVADGTSGLQIINISNPSLASIVKTVDTPGTAYDVKIYEKSGVTYAIVADGNAGVCAIDVTNPSSASIVSSLDTAGTASGVDIAFDAYHAKSFIYIADGSNGLVIIDPSNFTIVKTINTNGFAYNVEVSGGYAYVADGTNGLVIIDVSPVQYSSIVKTVDTPGTAMGVFISGDYAFVSDQSYGIQIIDINTLSIAQIIHSFNTNGSSYNLYYMNNYFYVADGSEGLVILGP